MTLQSSHIVTTAVGRKGSSTFKTVRIFSVHYLYSYQTYCIDGSTQYHYIQSILNNIFTWYPTPCFYRYTSCFLRKRSSTSEHGPKLTQRLCTLEKGKGLFESRCKLSPCPRKLLCACKRKWIGIADFETWCIVRWIEHKLEVRSLEKQRSCGKHYTEALASQCTLPWAMEGRLGGYRGSRSGKMYVCILGNEIFDV